VENLYPHFRQKKIPLIPFSEGETHAPTLVKILLNKNADVNAIVYAHQVTNALRSARSTSGFLLSCTSKRTLEI